MSGGGGVDLMEAIVVYRQKNDNPNENWSAEMIL